jgi:alanyl-tRNA synthetase
LNGNAKALQAVVLVGKKLGKSVYVMSADEDAGKVAHVNFVADDLRTRGLDGRVWANKVSEILGGKVSDVQSSCGGTFLPGLYGRSVEKRMVLKGQGRTSTESTMH